MNDKINCPICSTENTTCEFDFEKNHYFFNCIRCGRFISGNKDTNLSDLDKSMLSHWIRRQQQFYHTEQNPIRDERGYALNLDISDRKRYSEIFNTKISVQQKMDGIILKIGELSKFCGDVVSVTVFIQKEIAAFSGCTMNFANQGKLESEYTHLIIHLKDRGLLIADSNGYKLTTDGFAKYEQLQNQITDSRQVFMAMKFDKDQNNFSYQAKNCLEKILKDEFGLELFSMEHNQQVGNIIDVMKSKINDAKFIICDLSDGNRGAYWEAGYAEGQKKKVVYICNEAVFQNAEKGIDKEKEKIHFDIKQTKIIQFDFSDNDENKINDFKAQIVATIKANSLNI